MIEVKAPVGFEAARSYVDRLGWAAYARPVNGTWWTDCGWIGHAQMTPEELDQRAAEKVVKWVEHGLVR